MVTAGDVAGTAVNTSTELAASKTIAMTTLQKTILSATLAVAVGVGVYELHQAVQLRTQNQSLRQQVNKLLAKNERLSTKLTTTMSHLPAPPIQAIALAMTNTSPAETTGTTNFWERIKDMDVRVTHEQVESFLQANGRSAANLLAAYRAKREPALLKEAMKNFPNDPQVAFQVAEELLMRPVNSSSDFLTPDEQRQWLDAFKKSAPDNSLANYFSAINYFNAGQVDEGLKELSTASGKKLDSYHASQVEGRVEVFSAAGCSPAEAAAVGYSGALLPELSHLKELGQQMCDLASAYRQAGDTASAQTVLQMAVTLGRQYAAAPGDPFISQRAGMLIEQNALSAMDPNAPYGDNGQTVQDRLNQLEQQIAKAREMAHQAGALMPLLTPEDIINYKNRSLMFGEENAMQWVVSKYGQQ
jgi:hypothetical protein